MDLAKVVSTKESYEWTQTEWRLGTGYGKQEAPKYRVVAFDYGVKYNILRMLAERGCHVTVLPAQASAADALALNPDGIFLSNGPGDPEPCDYAIARDARIHRARHSDLRHLPRPPDHGPRRRRQDHEDEDRPPRREPSGEGSGRRPRGDHVAEPRLRGRCRRRCPPTRSVTHVSLFDGTLQGFALTDKPAFCFQGHPEASPGPHDIAYLFDRFTSAADGRKVARKARTRYAAHVERNDGSARNAAARRRKNSGIH